ncbi:hypothetical protein H6G97_12145 [Nostoc flagelliforme FACHB-838]|uniref:Uncharacterized protein n=1 Tax=Nostoc flagelliforme FACHB-838 TaxID=2692904 RepID=A0ABR8DLD7_9NOSO|nr:hypothetical protein [Nostoc flagelliforme]MBD2530281.1 hypothetical protein [Nostoc flagelliforme FACHB-838]
MLGLLRFARNDKYPARYDIQDSFTSIKSSLVDGVQRLVQEYQRLVNGVQRLVHEYQRLVDAVQRLVHEYQRLVDGV